MYLINKINIYWNTPISCVTINWVLFAFDWQVGGNSFDKIKRTTLGLMGGMRIIEYSYITDIM